MIAKTDNSTICNMKQLDLFSSDEFFSVQEQENVATPIEEFNDVEKLQELVKNLWSLLDDIDTVEDIAKDNDKLYRNLVEIVYLKRWNTGLKSDGYELYYDKK